MDGQVVMEWTRVNCWSEVPVLVLFSNFFELLINSNRTMSLINIRGIVWNQIIRYCPTFVARDCNAEFSEIPSSDIFRSLSNEEKVLASSRYRV